MYLKDPANTDVKKLLEEGVYVERAFPKDLFPALTGQALYRDAETRGYRGRAFNGSYAELHWSQVSLRKLSEAMKMSDELVKAVEKEEVEEDKVNHDAVSDHEKDGKYLLTFPSCLSTLIETLQDSEVDLKAVARASGGATAGNRRKRSVKINEIVDKGPSTRKRTRRAPPNRPPDPQPMLGTPFKLKFKPKTPPPRPHKAFSEDTSAPKATEQSPDSPIIAASASDLDIEDEERRRKQAELAWVKYLRGPHCS